MKEKKPFSFARFYQQFGVVVLLVIVFIAASLISPKFLTSQNLTNVLRQITVITVIGCGACFVLIAANINIAYDGLVPCIGCLSCMVMVATQNLMLSVLVGMFVGAIIGYLFGIFTTKFQVPGFIVALAFDSIAGGAILVATKAKSVSRTKLGNFKILGQGYIADVIPICVVIMLVVLVVCHIILTKTCFGMKVRALGGNRDAAIASGINVDRVMRQVFVLDGLTCALGAILYMSRLNSGEPTGGAGIAFDALTAVCVGGVSIQGGSGGIPGTLIGAAIVGILNNVMNLMNVNANWQDVVSGIVILVAIALDVFVKDSLAKNVKRT